MKKASDETSEAGTANLARLAAPVTTVPGIGRAYTEKLSPLGIRTIGDLLYHFPRKYLDRSTVTPIGQAKTGQEVTVVGRVRDVESRTTRSRKNILIVTIFDGTGYLAGVWFNQGYHKERLKEGVEVAFSGRVRYEYKRLQMVNPDYDILGDQGSGSVPEAIHTGRIIPVYPGTSGVTSAMLRRFASRALEAFGEMADPLPGSVREKFGLVDIAGAIREIHFPEGPESLKKARYRALFDEIFIMQAGLALKKKRRERESKGTLHAPPGELIARFRQSLPFELTSDQERAWGEIASDMGRSVAMNRLLQGEVGSGKTVVAVLALLLSVENGYQGAIMAPTEVLAYQHDNRVRKMLEGLPVSVALMTGGSEAEVQRAVASGEVDIVIGTHALIQKEVRFARLGVVVIDEQHRFGVSQRASLERKGAFPHVLHMSATPIPRTLSLTLYGDLDVSVIDELPAGRKGVVTVVADKTQRKGAFAMVGKEVALGRQVYVICPLVEESEKLEARAAEEEARRLAGVFPGYRTGLLHGQMKSEEKRSVMERFQTGEIDILISTLVVEVGMDVPNATVMIVENADRFGLAQLHQLRGRIGRGSERAICVLFADPATDEAKARMKAIQECDDGFALADEDLRIRGEGTLFGTRQSGLPDLKLVRLSRNLDLIRKARQEAFKLVDGDPTLKKPENALLRREVNRRFAGALEWLFHG